MQWSEVMMLCDFVEPKVQFDDSVKREGVALESTPCNGRGYDAV